MSHGRLYAHATYKVLLSNEFNILNLIGRARISGAGTTRCMHSHQTFFLLRLKGAASETTSYPAPQKHSHQTPLSLEIEGLACEIRCLVTH